MLLSVHRNGQLLLDATLTEQLYPRKPYADEAPMDTKSLTPTELAQPATVACALGCFDILQEAGFNPDMVAGHSLGELAALHVAGYMDRETLADVVVRRGQAMGGNVNSATDTAMVAILGAGASGITIPPRSGDVWIANKNGPQQVVVAGAKADVENFVKSQVPKSFRTVPLAVSNAFHTKFMSSAANNFGNTLREMTPRFVESMQQITQTGTQVFSNVTGREYPFKHGSTTANKENANVIVDTLSKHITSPVEFIKQVRSMYAAGARVFVEFGPRRALAKFAESILGDKDIVTIAVNATGPKGADSEVQLRDAVVQLAVCGVSLGKGFDKWALRNIHTLGMLSWLSKCTCRVLSC